MCYFILCIHYSLRCWPSGHKAWVCSLCLVFETNTKFSGVHLFRFNELSPKGLVLMGQKPKDTHIIKIEKIKKIYEDITKHPTFMYALPDQIITYVF